MADKFALASHVLVCLSVEIVIYLIKRCFKVMTTPFVHCMKKELTKSLVVGASLQLPSYVGK